eukprot:462490_1
MGSCKITFSRLVMLLILRVLPGTFASSVDDLVVQCVSDMDPTKHPTDMTDGRKEWSFFGVINKEICLEVWAEKEGRGSTVEIVWLFNEHACAGSGGKYEPVVIRALIEKAQKDPTVSKIVCEVYNDDDEDNAWDAALDALHFSKESFKTPAFDKFDPDKLYHMHVLQTPANNNTGNDTGNGNINNPFKIHHIVMIALVIIVFVALVALAIDFFTGGCMSKPILGKALFAAASVPASIASYKAASTLLDAAKESGGLGVGAVIAIIFATLFVLAAITGVVFFILHERYGFFRSGFVHVLVVKLKDLGKRDTTAVIDPNQMRGTSSMHSIVVAS